jgi:translation initiation factor IF-1
MSDDENRGSHDLRMPDDDEVFAVVTNMLGANRVAVLTAMNGQLEFPVECKSESGSVRTTWCLLNHGTGKMRKAILHGGMRNLKRISFVKRVVSGDRPRS